MNHIYINDAYYSEYSVNCLLEAIEEVEKVNELEAMARDVPWGKRSPEFQARLERQRQRAGERSEAVIILFGDNLLEIIQKGILEHMAKKDTE